MKKFKTIFKMKKTIINLGGIEIKKQKLYLHKRPNLIDNIDVNKIVVSNKNNVQYFICYKNPNKIRPLSYLFQK